MPIGLVRLDGPDHRFVAANAAYRSIVGREELIGRPLREALPEVEGQQLFELVARAYETGETTVVAEWRTSLAGGADGELREVYVDATVSPLRGDDGGMLGVLCHVVDVTAKVEARLRAESAAQDARDQLRRAAETVAALQSALLPHGLPILPAVDLAASYLLADAGTAAGGDWFDVIPLTDHRTALVVGDVVGHGVHAAAVMGQLRAVLAASLRDHEEPVAAVEALDTFAGTLAGAEAATVLVAVLDDQHSTLTYCTAGHPPPLHLPADGGEPTYLPPSGGAPLCAGLPVRAFEVPWEPGDTLMLYTDGLVERPGRTLAENTSELRKVAHDARHRPGLGASPGVPDRLVERVCRLTLELLTRATGHTDDITLLVAHRTDDTGAGPDLDLEGDPAAVRSVRTELGRWLLDLGVSPFDKMAVQHAVGEVVTNAIDHAYDDDTTRRPLHVGVRLTSQGAVEVAVTDEGRWRAPRSDSAQRGRGLAMAASFTDDLAIERRDDGTTVRVSHHVSRPAQLLGAQGFPSLPDGTLDRDFGTEILDPAAASSPLRTVRVRGPVDAASAEELEQAVLLASRGLAAPLVVDLSDVTVLGSAGVQVLTRATGSVTLLAPTGSPAQHVLELVQLPYRTSAAD